MPNRLPLPFILLLCLLYILPGLFGHGPWKQDEPYIFGIVRHMLHTHDWVVPVNAGIPFMEKPPLYYWLGTLFDRLTHPWLSEPDGVRLVSGLLTGITLLFSGMSARLAWGVGQGRLAVLSMLATFGLLFESHIMITDVAMLTGYAIASYGFLLGRIRPIRGGFWLGTGAGIGFLSKGLLIPGTLGVTALLLLLFDTWRQRAWYQAMLVACMTSLPWLVIWPAALWLRSPEWFYQWFWLNNVGRFLGFSVPQLGADNSVWFWPKTLPWFTWPILPLALFTLWRERRTLRQQPTLQFALVSFTVYLTVLCLSASARTAYGLPMLVSLALLATPATTQLPARLNLAGDYLARLLFLPCVILSWLVWGIFQITHHAPQWYWLTRGLNPAFVLPMQPIPVSLALLTSIAWIISWYWLPRLRARAVLSTALGITTFWMMFATLWLPWVDNAKSYHDAFIAAAHHVPATYNCVSGENLGESTRPMFDYYFGLIHIRHDNINNPTCHVRFIDEPGTLPPNIPAHWQIVWHGSRPQDDKDTFWLIEKTAS